MAGTPAGFSESDVLAGLYLAMSFGAPNDPAQQATFYKTPILDADNNSDDEGIPFDPTVNVNRTPVTVKRPCAIEYVDAADQFEEYGVRQPSKVKVTLLGPDYDAIVGDDPETVPPFSYITVGGQKYLYRKAEPVVALGSIDVHVIHCQAEDEL
jgi:hypothetical protein